MKKTSLFSLILLLLQPKIAFVFRNPELNINEVTQHRIIRRQKEKRKHWILPAANVMERMTTTFYKSLPTVSLDYISSDRVRLLGTMIKSILLLFCVLFVLVRCERNVLFPTLPVVAEQTENILCAQESKLYVQHLNNLTFWAQKSK